MRRHPFLLRPTSFAPSLAEISLDTLLADGVRGLIIDLDNTLVGYRALEPAAAVATWVANAGERGLKVIMVTNNRTAWAAAVAKNLGIGCIANAGKPFPRAFLRALKLLELPKDEVVVVGDQLFTDVLGAKLFGMKVILTEPIVNREEWWMRFLRFFERVALYRIPRA